MRYMLKRLRTERGMTQAQVAEAIGLTRSAYGEYERGTNTPPTDKLLALSRLFGVPPIAFRGNGGGGPDARRMLEYARSLSKASFLTYGGQPLDDGYRDMLLATIEVMLAAGDRTHGVGQAENGKEE